MFFRKISGPDVQALENRLTALRLQVDTLSARMDSHEKSLLRVADELGELADKHTRLRGKVYAHKIHKDAAADDGTPKPIDQMTRDELRRALTQSGRFVPGRPAKHE